MEWFKNLEKGEQFWIIAIALGLFYFCFFHVNQIDWSVEQSEEWTVQVYPNSENTKNYELPVDMDITEYRHGLRHNYYQYDIRRVTFPNEGYLEFDDCIVRNMLMADCTDQGGEEWGVKVLVTPDKPESDYDPDY